MDKGVIFELMNDGTMPHDQMALLLSSYIGYTVNVLSKSMDVTSSLTSIYRGQLTNVSLYSINLVSSPVLMLHFDGGRVCYNLWWHRMVRVYSNG